MSDLNFKGKNIAVLGLGLEGLSSANFLVKNGARVTICEQNPSFAEASEGRGEKEKIEVIRRLRKLNIDYQFGEDYLKNLESYDLVVRSPGIKLQTIKKALGKNEAAFDAVTSQTKLFFDLCPCKIIGVTGTKGKGTTSALIYEMLKKQNKDAYLVGNIGSPALDVLDKLNDQSIVIYELSSFQLQDLGKSPHVAVMLMTVPEHLDYHQDIDEYVNAKRNIFRFQKPEDYAIVNCDYPASNESDVETLGKVYKISREQGVAEDGAYVKDGAVWFRMNGKVASNAIQEKIIETKDILLPGAHNLENVCAAVIAASLCGVSRENIVSVLKTFKGLEHRLELVDTIHGVKYYDDSFSTTPETAIAAIQAFDNPEILILGGSSKNSDFTKLGRVIRDSGNIKAIIGIGSEWERIKSNINPPAGGQRSNMKIIEGCRNMKEIAQAAFDAAETGDIVLLSPACASFGMFKNYKDRGEQFKSEVLKLRTS